MQRKSIVCLLTLLLLAGCGPYSSNYGGNREFRPSDNRTFSYSHAIAVLMPHDSVEPRFERARDACLNDKALECMLVSASLNMREGSKEVGASAELRRRPAARQAGGFRESASRSFAARPFRQSAGALRAARKRKMSAAESSISTARSHSSRAYRDSLAALAKRPDTNVNDLIKLESELSKVQNDLDEALATKRDLGVSVAKESLHAVLSEKSALFDPIARVWSNGLDEFVGSTASAIDFLIRAIPWLPIVAGGVFLIRFSGAGSGARRRSRRLSARLRFDAAAICPPPFTGEEPNGRTASATRRERRKPNRNNDGHGRKRQGEVKQKHFVRRMANLPHPFVDSKYFAFENFPETPWRGLRTPTSRPIATPGSDA